MTPSPHPAPDISVIIPTYNRGVLLDQALDSCLEGQDVALEVIVVDDCSTDDTRARLARRDARVVPVLLETNHGSGAIGRNLGLARARGEFVKFLDHDDVLEPGTLRRELDVARRERADLVMSAFKGCEVDERGNRVPGWSREFAVPEVDGVIEAILRDETPYTSAVLYRRTHIADIQWDPAVTLQDDFDYFSRAALKPGRIARDPGFAYTWRRHPHAIQQRHRDNPLSFLAAAYTQEIIYRRVEAALAARGELTTARRLQLAQIFYNGVRAFARFDRARCRAVLDHVFELDPAFRPGPRADPSPLWRAAGRVLGVRPAVALYGAVRRLVDRGSGRGRPIVPGRDAGAA